jgi:hypothetical protein
MSKKCFVCDSMELVEDHHVIPRARGGSAGPEIPLCVLCHTKSHKYALSKKDPDLIKDPKLRKVVKVIKLATRKLDHADFYRMNVKVPDKLHTVLKLDAKSKKISMETLIVKVLLQHYQNERRP